MGRTLFVKIFNKCSFSINVSEIRLGLFMVLNSTLYILTPAWMSARYMLLISMGFLHFLSVRNEFRISMAIIPSFAGAARWRETVILGHHR